MSTQPKENKSKRVKRSLYFSAGVKRVFDHHMNGTQLTTKPFNNSQVRYVLQKFNCKNISPKAVLLIQRFFVHLLKFIFDEANSYRHKSRKVTLGLDHVADAIRSIHKEKMYLNIGEPLFHSSTGKRTEVAGIEKQLLKKSKEGSKKQPKQKREKEGNEDITFRIHKKVVEYLAKVLLNTLQQIATVFNTSLIRSKKQEKKTFTLQSALTAIKLIADHRPSILKEVESDKSKIAAGNALAQIDGLVVAKKSRATKSKVPKAKGEKKAPKPKVPKAKGEKTAPKPKAPKPKAAQPASERKTRSSTKSQTQ